MKKIVIATAFVWKVMPVHILRELAIVICGMNCIMCIVFPYAQNRTRRNVYTYYNGANHLYPLIIEKIKMGQNHSFPDLQYTHNKNYDLEKANGQNNFRLGIRPF